MPRFFAVTFVVQTVDLRRDAADRLAVLKGDKQCHLGIFKKGVFARMNHLIPLHSERRHPVRIGFVKFVREVDELSAEFFGGDGEDLNH